MLHGVGACRRFRWLGYIGLMLQGFGVMSFIGFLGLIGLVRLKHFFGLGSRVQSWPNGFCRGCHFSSGSPLHSPSLALNPEP